jgi:hypothetical protein
MYALSRGYAYFYGNQIRCVAMDAYSRNALEMFLHSRCLANSQMRHNMYIYIYTYIYCHV